MQRSYLYAPGHNAKILAKVSSSGADAVVLDLEDGVPRGLKEDARSAVVQWLRKAGEAGSSRSSEVWVRINEVPGMGTPESDWLADLEALAPFWTAIRGLRLPKAESWDAVAELDERLRALGAPDEFEVCLLFESALGVTLAKELCEHPRVTQAAFGAADFVADIGADPTDPLATYYAEAQLVLACRVAQIEPPILSVHTQLDDEAGLLASSRSGKSRGFFGRSVIHPKQLAAVHEVFTPTTAELDAALQVLAAAEQAEGGATTSGGQFVDEAVARRARAQVDLARRFSPSTRHEKIQGEGSAESAHLEVAKR